jgi:hypothetical protein
MPVSVVIIQPPLVQLNGPYPSGAYLSAFFRRLADDGLPAPAFVRWIDSGNDFFRDLFSSAGVAKLFSLCRADALAKASVAESAGDAETAFQLRRYVSLERAWVSWIDGIVSILCKGDRELSHGFVRSPAAPRGARMDAFLSVLDGEPSADDARMLATLALEDLADFIAAVFDPGFSLVRYAESVAAGVTSFSAVEAALSSPVVAHFVEPLYDRTWQSLDASLSPDDTILFCVSVPFPGCLVGALACARSIRLHYGARAVISMGGGYVNTELRSCENPRLFSYVDILSFDRGYGGYTTLMRSLVGGLTPFAELLADGIPNRLFCPPEYAEYEKTVTMTLSPDYSDIDFSRYPRLADDPNPMHRLWSDGTWLKAYLAHGCYWHRCSFCDVSLDYIAVYLPVGIEKLYRDLRRQAIAKGVHGIHLVDEAAPPRALRDFALENIRASRELPAGEIGLVPFWGNIRFEKTFTRDLADLLSAGGLVAVSGGIEIASAEGFKSVGKGIDLDNLVATCAAFKEAGVLVHSYLIYGYWNEDAQEVIDSAETMRQLFAEGLVDSAFWHKFTLTRHSRVFCEHSKGMHAALEPIDNPGDFAENTLSFKGEREGDRYSAPLATALGEWMSGNGLDRPIRSWFPFATPSPRVSKNLIEGCIAKYERERDRERNKPCESDALYYWAGSNPLYIDARIGGRAGSTASGELIWWYLGEEVRIAVTRSIGEAVCLALAPFGVAVGSLPCDSELLSALPLDVFTALRHHGLCKISPLS